MSQREAYRAATTALVIETERSRIKGKVLDVGCGAKPYKRLFPGLEWIGLDIRPVAELQADFHDIPADDASFDTVLCTDALQFAADPARVVREMARVLRPDGLLLLVAPDAQEDDGSALWGFRVAGLVHLINQAESLIPTQVLPINSSWGGILTGHLRDFMGALHKGLNEDLQAWVAEMDRRFPTMVATAAIKKGAEEPGQ